MNNNTLDKAKEILKKYNQEHLLCLYNELSDDEKQKLVNQILNINFEEILKLYKNSFKEDVFSLKDISPLEHFEKSSFTQSELYYYSSLGEQEIKNDRYAVVTMAGGQGTRLGYKGPKGTYMLDLEPNKKSLFQIMCEDIKNANK